MPNAIDPTVAEPCCQQRENRTQPEPGRQVPGGTAVVEVCRVCGRRHYLLLADPVRFGMRLAGLGKEE